MENEINELEMKLINVSKKVVENYGTGKFNPELIISYKPKEKKERLKIKVYLNEKGKEPSRFSEFYLENRAIQFLRIGYHDFAGEISAEYYKTLQE